MNRFFFTALLLAVTFGFTACDKDEPSNGNGNGNGNGSGNTYSKMIVGTWHVTNLTFNGQDMTPQNLLIVFNNNGTGLLNDNGETENNNFKWEINMEEEQPQLIIMPGDKKIKYKIESMTAANAVISGNTIPGMDNMQGEVSMSLEKQAK